ncbi:hypothetical protein CGRA01v4_00655 [Colletotrichum graminicola]|nr:hypothetical protein CGRA01v4_00655 [Colletotrichum graminicola]
MWKNMDKRFQKQAHHKIGLSLSARLHIVNTRGWDRVASASEEELQEADEINNGAALGFTKEMIIQLEDYEPDRSPDTVIEVLDDSANDGDPTDD